MGGGKKSRGIFFFIYFFFVLTPVAQPTNAIISFTLLFRKINIKLLRPWCAESPFNRQLLFPLRRSQQNNRLRPRRQQQQ